MLGAFMAMMDIQITNSSLKEIQGALSATLEEGSWISTSYLVAEIIMIPLTAWLTQLLSVRRLAVWITSGFMVSSVLCSLAWNLESMIVFRALQGFSGGALIPLAFTLSYMKVPDRLRPKTMALFALTATFAPSIGPTLGGWLTDNFGWEYIFYINLPPALLMIAGLMYSLDREKPNWSLLKQTDYAGIVCMAIGLGCLQVFLEEGYRKDWLESSLIVTLGCIAFIALGLFVILQFSREHPLINLRILGDRNFGLGGLSVFFIGMAIYGTVFLLTLYLAQIQNYNPQQIGSVMLWTGLPQLLVIPLVPVLLRKADPRWMAAAGLFLVALSSYANSQLSLDFGGEQLTHTLLIRAIGQPLVMVTSSLICMAYLMPKDVGSGSSLYNVLRNLGGAVGIALLATLIDNRTKTYFDYLREAVIPGNPQVAERITLLTEKLGSETAALGKISEITHQQAQIMAFNDAFLAIAIGVSISLICILLTKKLPANASSEPVH
ncbi:MAG TPA: MDR family MFS transporter [Pseudomonas sp.]|nr:MDR family MFS transporter [Pseudomonas sp.]